MPRREFLGGALRSRRHRTPVTDHPDSTTGSLPRLRVFTVALLFIIIIGASVPLVAAEAESTDAWKMLLGRIVNFAVLVAVLVYFLRSPFASYLRGRGAAIRKDISDAAAVRTTAEKQLADVRSRLAALPAELETLRRRGEQELADERARMKEATDREREHLLERTRRDIDIQSRLARKALLEDAATLAVTRTRERIERDITPADQARLIERYAGDVRL